MPGLSGVLPGMAGRKAAGRRLVQMAHGSVLETEAGEKHLTSPDSAGYATARGHGAIHMLLERPRSGHLVTPHDSFASMAPFLGGSAIYDPATDCDACSENKKKIKNNNNTSLEKVAVTSYKAIPKCVAQDPLERSVPR